MPDTPIHELGANTELLEDENGHTVVRNTMTGAEMTLGEAAKFSEAIGTESEPIPNQSHFEAVSTEDTHTRTIGAGEYHYAGDYDGGDADARLDNAIEAANGTDVIYAENSIYEDNRTIDKDISLSGTHNAIGGSGNSRIRGDWTLTGRVCLQGFRFEGASLTVDNILATLSRLSSVDITVTSDIVLITECDNSDVTFETGTEDGLVDSCTRTSVTDNGTNTVGDIS